MRSIKRIFQWFFVWNGFFRNCEEDDRVACRDWSLSAVPCQPSISPDVPSDLERFPSQHGDHVAQWIADILTKGNFTRDAWNNLLHLFNISHFSSACCAQHFSLTSCPKTMAKGTQEQEEEEGIVAKSKPMAMNLTSTEPSDCVKKPRDNQRIYRET